MEHNESQRPSKFASDLILNVIQVLCLRDIVWKKLWTCWFQCKYKEAWLMYVTERVVAFKFFVVILLLANEIIWYSFARNEYAFLS